MMYGYTYLEYHGLVAYLGTRKDVEAERPSHILLSLATPVKGADAHLESCELLYFKFDFLISLFHSIVLVVDIIQSNVKTYINDSDD